VGGGTKLGTRDEIICAVTVLTVDGADLRRPVCDPAGEFEPFWFT
jgi:hypothetical protein